MKSNKRINMDKEDPEKASPKFPVVINLCAIISITSAILLTIIICEVVIHNESKGKIRFLYTFHSISLLKITMNQVFEVDFGSKT